MDHYIDITLRPDPEFPPAILMNALFSKLHRGLVDWGGRDIGVSFPDVAPGKRTLGARLRLHGSKASLEQLMSNGWTHGMRDHTEIGATTAVPVETSYRIVRRVQAKSSPERLRRRLMVRKAIEAEEARTAIPDSAAEMLPLPYVEIRSRTTGQQFKLFVEHLPLQASPTSGEFGSYGLSQSASVPWF